MLAVKIAKAEKIIPENFLEGPLPSDGQGVTLPQFLYPVPRAIRNELWLPLVHKK